MAYSVVGIVNLALMRLGSSTVIASLNDNSPTAIKANAVWEYVRDEVLEAREWRWAKVRAKLARSTTLPAYGYKYAYPLPNDFLTLCAYRQHNTKGLNPVSYPPGYWYYIVDVTGFPRTLDYDPPVYPPGYPYVVEALPDGTFCLFTDYDNTASDLYINYIRKETNPTKYSPTFISALAFRLAAELALSITELSAKFKTMMDLYFAALVKADERQKSFDWVENESGSTEWQDAGR